MCRKKTQLPTRNILDLPKNIVLANGVEKLKASHLEGLPKSTVQSYSFTPLHSSNPESIHASSTLLPSAPPPDEDDMNVGNNNYHTDTNNTNAYQRMPINNLEFPLQSPSSISSSSPPLFEEKYRFNYSIPHSLKQQNRQEEIDRQLAMTLQEEEDARVSFSSSVLNNNQILLSLYHLQILISSSSFFLSVSVCNSIF
jgi:hypothetical protein